MMTTSEPRMAEGSALYRLVVSFAHDDAERGELMRKVWAETPWMVDAFTGGNAENLEREQAIREWCTEQFGPEAWPIHGKPGNWQRGGATIYGYTWMGFATEEMMQCFLDTWGGGATDDH